MIICSKMIYSYEKDFTRDYSLLRIFTYGDFYNRLKVAYRVYLVLLGSNYNFDHIAH